MIIMRISKAPAPTAIPIPIAFEDSKLASIDWPSVWPSMLFSISLAMANSRQRGIDPLLIFKINLNTI